MATSAPKGKNAAVKATQSTAAPKAAAKKTPVKGGAKKMRRGDRYACEVCGVVVSVDEACGCVDAHGIICCGRAMTAKR